jgi:hypothetical protein
MQSPDNHFMQMLRLIEAIGKSCRLIAPDYLEAAQVSGRRLNASLRNLSDFYMSCFSRNKRFLKFRGLQMTCVLVVESIS